MSLLQAEEYFIFSIDPVASVAHLEDDEATAAAQKLQSGRYVGLVMDWAAGPPIVGLDYAVDVLLVSYGLPHVPTSFVLPEMSYPIAPNDMSHPLGRQPIISDPPLPWSNCFHPTWARTVLRFQYDVKDPRTKGNCILSPGVQVIDLEDAAGEDREWGRAILEEQGGPDSTCPPKTDGEKPFVFVPFLPDEDFLIKQPLVKFSLDLSSLSPEEIGDPCDFFEESKALEIIMEAHKAKIAARIAATEELNAKQYGTFVKAHPSLETPPPAADERCATSLFVPSEYEVRSDGSYSPDFAFRAMKTEEDWLEAYDAEKPKRDAEEAKLRAEGHVILKRTVSEMCRDPPNRVENMKALAEAHSHYAPPLLSNPRPSSLLSRVLRVLRHRVGPQNEKLTTDVVDHNRRRQWLPDNLCCFGTRSHR